VYEWDEAKRRSNLEKHGLDFRDAWLVYENPEKLTYISHRGEESRWMDLAMVLIHGRLLVLIYTMRGKKVRIISFRPASREERDHYGRETRRE
jgi:uncharacterized DUF497 family protein